MKKEKIEELQKYFDKLKTIYIEKIDDEKNFLTIEKYNCTLGNGNIIRREKILKDGNDGSASIIFPITEDGKVILAIEPRVFTKETVDMGLPAGYIEKDENPINAAKRELLEETGYMSEEFIHLGSFYQDQGCSGALNHYYIAYNCKKVTEQSLDEGEFIKFILVDIDDLSDLIKYGYIKGLNSAYLITASLNILNKENIKSYKNLLKP